MSWGNRHRYHVRREPLMRWDWGEWLTRELVRESSVMRRWVGWIPASYSEGGESRLPRVSGGGISRAVDLCTWQNGGNCITTSNPTAFCVAPPPHFIPEVVGLTRVAAGVGIHRIPCLGFWFYVCEVECWNCVCTSIGTFVDAPMGITTPVIEDDTRRGLMGTTGDHSTECPITVCCSPTCQV